MEIFVLDAKSADVPVRTLLDRLGHEGLRICDSAGREIAVLRPAAVEEERLYEDATAAALAARATLDDRAMRRDGLSIEELCRRVGMPAVDRS